MKKMMKTFALAIALLLAAGSVTGTYAASIHFYEDMQNQMVQRFR